MMIRRVVTRGIVGGLLAVLGGALACSSEPAPQERGTGAEEPAAAMEEPEAPPAARELMERVNAKYASIHSTPRRVTVTHTTTTQWPGKAPTTFTSETVIHQQGENAHVETKPGTLERPAVEDLPAFSGPGHSRHVWVHNAASQETRTLHETHPSHNPEGESRVTAWKKQHADLPGEHQMPLANAEIPDEVLDAPFDVETVRLDGAEHYLLSSQGPVALQADTRGSMQIWVDAETLLITRIVTDTEHTMAREEGSPVVSTQADYRMRYDFDVPIDATLFELELPEDHVDVTELTLRELERTGGLPTP